MTSSLFPLGQKVITVNAVRQLAIPDIYSALERHSSGDWGDVCETRAGDNEVSLKEGLRLMSVYRDRNGTQFYIITEADRSATTVLLPEEC